MERNRNRLDLVIGKPRIIGVTLTLLEMQGVVRSAGIIGGPLGGPIVDGRHEPIVASGN